MPGFDRTGPFGTGPAGRGLGPCGSGLANRGRGWGTGRNGWNMKGALPSVSSKPDEKSVLEQQKSFFEAQLEAISERLHNLEKDNK